VERGEVDRAAVAIEREAALAGSLQGLDDPVRVAQQEIGEVHQRPAVGVERGDLEAPQHRLGERLLHRAALGRVARFPPGSGC
jgi:hypothetical protein